MTAEKRAKLDGITVEEDRIRRLPMAGWWGICQRRPRGRFWGDRRVPEQPPA